jgi:hypothetical protein
VGQCLFPAETGAVLLEQQLPEVLVWGVELPDVISGLEARVVMLALQAIAQTILRAAVDGLVEMVEVCLQHLTQMVTQRAAAGLDLVAEMSALQVLQRHKQAAAVQQVLPPPPVVGAEFQMVEQEF